MAASLKRTEYYYNNENTLQSVAVWEFPQDQQEASSSTQPPGPTATKKYWLIFLHGGAWRDPRGTFDEAQPTIDALLLRGDASSSSNNRIAGFASLNYRLSPHPSFAQDPATTPSFALRAARHPDHLHDVCAGLRFLQARFGFGGDYVLFGHSAGAFMGYRMLLPPPPEIALPLPTAVVGFEGIYDLEGLDARKGGTYAGFMEAAFGPRDGWREASPAVAPGTYAAWGGGARLAVLAQSVDDELVDMAECDVMEARLRADGVANVRVYRDLKGAHFEVVRDGSFARVLRRTLEELGGLEGK